MIQKKKTVKKDGNSAKFKFFRQMFQILMIKSMKDN